MRKIDLNLLRYGKTAYGRYLLQLVDERQKVSSCVVVGRSNPPCKRPTWNPTLRECSPEPTATALVPRRTRLECAMLAVPSGWILGVMACRRFFRGNAQACADPVNRSRPGPRLWPKPRLNSSIRKSRSRPQSAPAGQGMASAASAMRRPQAVSGSCAKCWASMSSRLCRGSAIDHPAGMVKSKPHACARLWRMD